MDLSQKKINNVKHNQIATRKYDVKGIRVRPIIGYTDITDTDTDNRYRYRYDFNI